MFSVSGLMFEPYKAGLTILARKQVTVTLSGVPVTGPRTSTAAAAASAAAAAGAADDDQATSEDEGAAIVGCTLHVHNLRYEATLPKPCVHFLCDCRCCCGGGGLTCLYVRQNQGEYCSSSAAAQPE